METAFRKPVARDVLGTNIAAINPPHQSQSKRRLPKDHMGELYKPLIEFNSPRIIQPVSEWKRPYWVGPPQPPKWQANVEPVRSAIFLLHHAG